MRKKTAIHGNRLDKVRGEGRYINRCAHTFEREKKGNGKTGPGRPAKKFSLAAGRESGVQAQAEKTRTAWPSP